MSTRRERLESRAEKRAQWAASRAQKAQQASQRAHDLSQRFEMGQPILVGHHSEKSARRDQQRMWDATERAGEHRNMAEDHAGAAAGIERQLDRSVFSDDPDAIERLEERVAEMEATREAMKAANAEFRKVHGSELKTLTPYLRSQAMPFQSYQLSNLGGEIRRNRQRIESIRVQQAQEAEGRPTRIVQARRDGTCERCGGSIEAGQTIGRLGTVWAHVRPEGDLWVLCEEA